MHLHIVNGLAILRDDDGNESYQATLANFRLDLARVGLTDPQVPSDLREVMVDPAAATSGKLRYAITVEGDQVIVPQPWLDLARAVMARQPDLVAAQAGRSGEPLA